MLMNAMRMQTDVLVGSQAQQQAVLNPRNTFSSIKRVIGQHWSEVQAELQHASYGGRQAEGRGVELWCPARCSMHEPCQLSVLCMLCSACAGTCRGVALSPEQLSSHILRHLIQQAEAALCSKADAAVRLAHLHAVHESLPASLGKQCELSLYAGMQVIAVPAHFSAAQRAATLEAGRVAGLTRLQLLQGTPFTQHAFCANSPCAHYYPSDYPKTALCMLAQM